MKPGSFWKKFQSPKFCFLKIITLVDSESICIPLYLIPSEPKSQRSLTLQVRPEARRYGPEGLRLGGLRLEGHKLVGFRPEGIRPERVKR